MPESKVYILGAGCSKDCGYPLGAEMKADLEQFGRSLDSARSPRLQRAVADTLALFGTTTETIDVLVQKLYGGNLDEIYRRASQPPATGNLRDLGNLRGVPGQGSIGERDRFSGLPRISFRSFPQRGNSLASDSEIKSVSRADVQLRPAFE
jgi:hypothetical protein